MSKNGISKQEWRYILYAALFAIIYFIFILPYIIEVFDGKSEAVQFIIFNVGLYFFFFIFLKAVTTCKRINFSAAFGLLILFLALDILLPEYHVTTQGELLKGAALGVSSTDYILGLIASTIGLTGIGIYIFTYVVVPVAFLFISAKIFPNFIKHI